MQTPDLCYRERELTQTEWHGLLTPPPHLVLGVPQESIRLMGLTVSPLNTKSEMVWNPWGCLRPPGKRGRRGEGGRGGLEGEGRPMGAFRLCTRPVSPSPRQAQLGQKGGRGRKEGSSWTSRSTAQGERFQRGQCVPRETGTPGTGGGSGQLGRPRGWRCGAWRPELVEKRSSRTWKLDVVDGQTRERARGFSPERPETELGCDYLRHVRSGS